MSDFQDDPHAAWVARVVARCGDVILSRFDPSSQRAMTFHSDSWKKWNPNDADVAWALDRFKDGIHRRDLWALSEDLSTPMKRRRAFVATLLWGVGTTNRYYGRHSQALAFGDLEEILEKTVAQVSRDDLEDAWSTAARIPGLEYRFFTKWLWVAGVNQRLQAPPLVFDSQVRLGLQKTNWPFHTRRINECQRWVNYCSDAAAVGRELGVASEWVEYWLFSGAPSAPSE
ncbi:hypothetical protein [Mycobacterium malmoense]|uniref:8-oxoguanine DNA glycosylase OGG fold protein n=1 Tax=Mycobacterium malmoense TaxID=1780 RepID=UPI0011464F8F|nr:hypothetical protein [Mycobacterium malmoense]